MILVASSVHGFLKAVNGHDDSGGGWWGGAWIADIRVAEVTTRTRSEK